MNPTVLDSEFPGLSKKISFIQFGALNRHGLIFETRYRSVFEIKWKRFNSNNWAAREKLTGRPAKRSASAGCLSGCPHSSVRQGVRRGMGRCGAFDLVLIQRLRVIVDVGQRRRDRNLARPVRGAGGSPGYRRGSARRANDEVDDGESPGTGGFSWGGSNRWLPSFPVAAGSDEIPTKCCSPCSGNGVARSVRRGE